MIVQAYLTASSLDGFAPSEIMYMPAGHSTIEAKVGGEPKEIDVNVTARTAEILQADLEKLLDELQEGTRSKSAGLLVPLNARRQNKCAAI